MGKKPKKRKIIAFDFEIGISEIIPSTRLTRKEETESIKAFKAKFWGYLEKLLKGNDQFPTEAPIFVYIQQYFASKSEYDNRDVDNFSKTILDILKQKIINDDSQVKTLLVSKKIDSRVPQNFAYVAIKEIKSDEDIEALKVSNIDRSIDLFNEIKKQKK